MRIKVYLASLILFCLLGGYLLDLLLSFQYERLQKVSSTYHASQLVQKDLTKLKNNVNQYIISADLILGSGNTYLLPGNYRLRELLIDNIHLLKEEGSLADNQQLLSVSIKQINAINALLEKIDESLSDDIASLQKSLLDIYDKESTLLIETVEGITQQHEMQQQALLADVEREEFRLSSWKWSSRIFFLISLLFIWAWAHKKISRPLLILQNFADDFLSHKAEAGKHEPLSEISSAPREVVWLSEAFQELTSELRFMAERDPLTKLYNRRVLINQLTHSMEVANRHNRKLSVLFFDLDGFKQINDTLGHAVGDQLIKDVAKRVSDLLRKSDTFARMGGDEFAILVQETADTQDLSQLAQKITDAFNMPFNISQHGVKVTSSMGIARYSVASKGKSAEELIQDADVAMYKAKSLGKNCYQFYSEEMNFDSLDRSSSE